MVQKDEKLALGQQGPEKLALALRGPEEQLTVSFPMNKHMARQLSEFPLAELELLVELVNLAVLGQMVCQALELVVELGHPVDPEALLEAVLAVEGCDLDLGRLVAAVVVDRQLLVVDCQLLVDRQLLVADWQKLAVAQYKVVSSWLCPDACSRPWRPHTPT